MLWSLYAYLCSPPLSFQLCVTDEGTASLTRTSDGGRQVHLGVYQGSLEAKSIARLRSFLQASRYLELGAEPGEGDDPAGSLLLGEGSYGHPPAQYRRIQLRSAKDAMAHLVSCIHGCANQLRAGPTQVCALSASWLPSSRQDEVAMVVEISNPGTSRVELGIPSALLRVSTHAQRETARLIPVQFHRIGLPARDRLELAPRAVLRIPGVAQLPPGLSLELVTLALDIPLPPSNPRKAISGQAQLLLPTLHTI